MDTSFDPPVPPSKRGKSKHLEIIVESEQNNDVEEIIAAEESATLIDSQFIEHEIVHASRYRKIGRFCLLVLVFFVPFFVLPFTSAPVNQAKNLLLSVLVSLATISFLGVVIRERRFEMPKSRLGFAIATLLGVQIISTIFSKNPQVSFYGNLAVPDALLNFLLYGLLFFLTFFFFRAENLKKIARWFFSGIAITAILGIVQLFGRYLLPWNFTRETSFNSTGSITAWGILLAAVFALIAEMPLQTFSRRNKWVLILLGASVVFGLVVLNFQLLWISIALLMIVIAAFHFVTHNRFGGSLVLVVVALFLALTSQSLPVLRSVPLEVRPTFGVSGSIAKSIIGPRFLFGIGPATFPYEWTLHRPVALNTTQFWQTQFSQGFGFYITALTTTGVVSLLAFLLLILAFFRSVIHLLDNREALVIAAGISFLFISMLFFPASISGFTFLFFGLGLLARLEGRVGMVDVQKLTRKKSFSVFMSCVILMALMFAALYTLTQKYIAAAYGASSLRAIASGDTGHAIQAVQSATNLDGSSDEYFRSASQVLLVRINQLSQANASNSTDAGIRAEFQSDVANVVFAARRATELNPLDVINWINLAQSYEGLIPLANGADLFADASYRKAMEIDPQNPSLPTSLARVLGGIAERGDAATRAKKLEEAHAMIDAALRLKSDYAPAHFFAAQLYIQEGNSDKATAKFNEAKAASPFDQGLAFQIGLIYYQMNQFSAAQREFERAINIDPNYANARYFLGLTYDRSSQKSLALEQFKILQSFFPDNAEIKRIVNNLTAGRGALQDIAPPATPPEKRSDVPVSEKKL